MIRTINEVLEYLEEDDVKFIRLTFCDIFGQLKNINIMSSELNRAFEYGIPIEASVIEGFAGTVEGADDADLFLFPDLTTLTTLPWRPQQGKVIKFYCDIKYPDGSMFENNCRLILERTIKKLDILGYRCNIGPECEFYLFNLDEHEKPTIKTYDSGGYLDMEPLDKSSNIRRDICLTLEEMGINPELTYHGHGPGQSEIDFSPCDALKAADNLVIFKKIVQMMARRNGLYASFLPKPLEDHSGNGLHLNIALLKNGINMFENENDEFCEEAKSFIAGILNRIGEITLFLNPLITSYKRFGTQRAPLYTTWSHQNRSQLIRIPAASGRYNRIELRSPDPSCNPYLALSLIIEAGMEGIKNNYALCEPTNINLFSTPQEVLNKIPKLPTSLGEAITIAEQSEFIKDVLPETLLNKFLIAKKLEWQKHLKDDKEKGIFEESYLELV